MVRIFSALLILRLTMAAQTPSDGVAVDKARIESYIRYAEGFTSGVKIAIDDPEPTPYANYSKLVAHVSLGTDKFTRIYYLSRDGQNLVDGKVWDLKQTPFLSTIRLLPTDGPSFGPAGAKVTVVIFSDFQCPYCRELATTIRQHIPEAYPNDVRVIFVDFPLESIHPWAHAMAEAVHCTTDGDNAAFWMLHDWIFEHQQEFTKDNLRDKVLAWAGDHKLDSSKIGSCIDSRAAEPIVQRGIQLGDKLEVSSTPSLFINGRMLSGAQKWPTIDAVIKLELTRPKDVSGSEAGKNQ